MARLRIIAAVAGAQWQAYKRRVLRRGGAGAANLSISVLLAALLLPWVSRALSDAAMELASGKDGRAAMLLCGLAAAWLCVGLVEARLSMRVDELRHLPLPAGELFAVDLLSMLMQVPALIVAAASLMMFYPIVNGARPVRGAAAWLLFVVAACAAGYALARLANASVGYGLVRFAAIGCVVFALWSVIEGGGSLQAIDPEGFGALLPHRAAARAATAKGTWIELGALACTACAACGVARASFAASLRSSTGRAPRRRRYVSAINLPGALGGLAGKDLRYFSRVLDVYIGFALAILYGFRLVVADAPSANAFRAVLIGVVLADAGVAFNSFGLDARAAFDRYAVLPLRGAGVVRAKNIAFALLIAAQVFPLFALACWRFGAGTAAAALLQVVALACAFMAVGNVSSVRRKCGMRFYRFAAGGSVLDYAVGAVFGCAPGFVFVVLLHGRVTVTAVSACVLCTILCAALYAFSVVRSGKRFESDGERIIACRD